MIFKYFGTDKQILKDFLTENDFPPDTTSARLDCAYFIRTENNFELINCEVLVSVDEAIVTVLNKLDNECYPTVFKQRHHKMYVEYGALLISGKHPNKSIGKYTIEIDVYGKVTT